MGKPVKKTARDAMQAVGLDNRTETVTPPSMNESEMAQSTDSFRRRRARGIRTSVQGTNGRASKTLLGN
tara:strand:+ start:141 stop:347 length:207 start_codon:yes stop_codon:yes gene_type:complete